MRPDVILMPTWVFNALTIVALLALAWVSRRAFFLRTYVRPDYAFSRARGIPIAFMNRLGVAHVPRAGSTNDGSLVQNVTMSAT